MIDTEKAAVAAMHSGVKGDGDAAVMDPGPKLDSSMTTGSIPSTDSEQLNSEMSTTKLEAQIPNPNIPPEPYTAISPNHRRLILLIVTVSGFFGPLSGGIYLPALPVFEREFNASSVQINATVSVFMVVFAVGPLFWAAFSDWRGRRPLYIISFAIFTAANIALAVIPTNYAALMILRIVQAIGSCSVASMGAGTVADVTEMKKRAFVMSIFLLGPQCGPILGPVLGGVFAGHGLWRWIFGFLAIASFITWLAIIFFLPETLRSRVGNGASYKDKSFLIFPPALFTAPDTTAQLGPRPPKPSPKLFWNLFIYAPIGLVSLNTAVLFASYYCVAITQPHQLADRYGWSTTSVGLSYLAAGIAMVLGSLSGGKASDWRRARTILRSPTGTVDPENRLFDQVWGVLLCSAGCLMYGWFLDFSISPVAVLVATFLAGFGMTWVFITSTSFLVECAPTQAAGVFALGGLLRNPAAAIAAVIIDPLAQKMGVGWCFTGLALIDLFVVGGSVVLLRIKGPGWRKARELQLLKN